VPGQLAHFWRPRAGRSVAAVLIRFGLVAESPMPGRVIWLGLLGQFREGQDGANWPSAAGVAACVRSWSAAIVAVMADAPSPRVWKTPWQYARDNDKADVKARREAEPECDGRQPYDSPILFWSRRIQRHLEPLTPWSEFGYLLPRRRQARSWRLCDPDLRRPRYYAEDYYVLFTTAFVALWACLTVGLTQASSWHSAGVAWVLLLPGVLLVVLYVFGKNWLALAWMILLVAAVWAAAVVGLGGWILWLVPWPLVLRVIEILLTLVRIISFDTLPGGYMHTPVSRVKYLYYTILYVVQMCFIYTAIYAFWVPNGFHDPSHCASGVCAPVTGLNNHIYLSVTTLTTLGSGFQASSGLAQWLQVSEVAFGLLLLAVGLAAFVGSLPLISLESSGHGGGQPGGL
jgi:hypothetical protein